MGCHFRGYASGPRREKGSGPVEDVKELFRNPDRWQILDVREQWEWDAGHVEGAVHVPLSEVMAGGVQDSLKPGHPVAVICRSGNRSELGALILQSRGVDAVNVEGGMEAWSAAGLPIISSSGAPGGVA